MNIYQRLAAVMGEVDYIQKEKKQGMRYSIVSHDAVTAKVRPLLVKHGVVCFPADIEFSQDGNRTQVKMRVRFVNKDDPKDWVETATLGYGIDEQDKGPGKAISYAVKYALLKTLGLETGDDPDQDQETEHKPATGAKADFERIRAALKSATDAPLIDDIMRVNAKALETIKAQNADAYGRLVQGAAERKTELLGKAA